MTHSTSTNLAAKYALAWSLSKHTEHGYHMALASALIDDLADAGVLKPEGDLRDTWMEATR